MKRLRLIKPWRLRALRQRVEDNDIGREGTRSVACRPPLAEYIMDMQPRDSRRNKGQLMTDGRCLSRGGLMPYFETTSFDN